MTQAPAAERLSEDARALADEVIALRREFHRRPELNFDLPWTSGRVASYLKDLGLPVSTGIGQSGVVAVLESGRPGPTALYRADMDGLPLLEETGLPFASENAGQMHACGHDGHIAVGLTLAKLMTSRRKDLRGKIAFLFQPAEEGAGGAEAMINDGVLDKVKPDACFAMHLNNDEECGTVGARPGPVFAGSGEFYVTLSSKGGHGAAPHQTVDLIVVAAQMISALQTVVSRNVDPRQSIVVTVGQVHIGTKTNILPTSGEFSGTIRYYDKELNDSVVKRVDELLGGIARAHNAGYRFVYDPGYPATINDVQMAQLARQAISPVAKVSDYWTTGSEDMSYFLDRVPGCYYTVGSKNEAKGKVFAHHSGKFDIDEDALVLAVDVGARVLTSYLDTAAL
jgi:amidohydrolase